MQEIICVLDMSGSMMPVENDAVGGFNQFLKDQKEIKEEANLTVFWFDDKFKVGYEGNLKEMEPLKEWPIGGMTALTDAIGKSFSHVADRFHKEKPEKVVMAILTDGFENASKEFTKTLVAKLIADHKEKYGWTVIFLAADQDAWNVSKTYNVGKGSTYSYDSANTRQGFGLMSTATGAARVK